MAQEFTVAIELGSSKMTGVAGRKNLDGSITILAVVKEDASQCIRKGIVYNIDKTVQCLQNVVKKLENALQTKITKVYVGVGGQSIRSVRNVTIKDMETPTIVTQDMINELMDSNRSMSYPEQEILDAITQEYKVDQQFQLDPVGIECSRLEGNFLNILWRKAFYRNLNKCFANANLPIAEMFLAPLALADSVLTESERRAGSLLVDLGADTTTVCVYYKNILRHLAVIPLGSNNITKDISSLQMEDSEAEAMKLKYGSAFTDNADIDNNLQLAINSERTVESRKFIDIVEGRMQEIIENVWFQVPNEYADKLLGGIVLTGGGSNMKNIERAFRNHTRMEKIRIAKTVSQPLSTNNLKGDIATLPDDGTMNTVLGLLAKGDLNCAGEEIRNDLFATDEQRPSATGGNFNTQPQRTGVVQTEAEKQKAEEEARLRREEEEERQRQEAEEEARRLEEERRQNAPAKKFMRTMRKFFDALTGDENDD